MKNTTAFITKIHLLGLIIYILCVNFKCKIYMFLDFTKCVPKSQLPKKVRFTNFFIYRIFSNMMPDYSSGMPTHPKNHIDFFFPKRYHNADHKGLIYKMFVDKWRLSADTLTTRTPSIERNWHYSSPAAMWLPKNAKYSQIFIYFMP